MTLNIQSVFGSSLPSTYQAPKKPKEERLIAPPRKRPKATNPWNLTARQVQIIETILETGGCTAASKRLGIVLKTVEQHLYVIRQKMGGINSMQACIVFDRWARDGIE